MAAQFIVEDGSGLVNSNSYCTVAEATQYHENYGAPAAWTAADSAAKEAALRKAAQYIDANFSFKGFKRVYNQKMQWPRYDVYDDSNNIVESNIVPVAIKEAAAMLALSALTENLMPDLAEPGTIGAESFTVGPISEDKTYIGGKGEQKTYSLVDAKLLSLTKNVGEIRRG